MYLPLFTLLFLALNSWSAPSQISGFFIQPSLGYGGTNHSHFQSQSEYDVWVQGMADLGAEYLIIQWSARYEHQQTWYSSAFGGASDADFTYYEPSDSTINGISIRGWSTDANWTGTPSQGGEEPLTYILEAAKQAGIQVFLGLYLNEGHDSFNWWEAIQDTNLSSRDTSIIQHHIDRTKQVISDLNQSYGSHPALAGFYFTPEIANLAFIPPRHHPYLSQVLSQVADQIHTLNPQLKMSICPFYNPDLSTAQEFEDLWTHVLQNADIDIMILQDGAGVMPEVLSQEPEIIQEFFQAMQAATSQAGIPLWANIESFTNLGTRAQPQFIPSDTSLIQQQIQLVAPYVERIVSFAYNYIEPNAELTNIDATARQEFHQQYLEYLANHPTHLNDSEILTNTESNWHLNLPQKTLTILDSKQELYLFNTLGQLIFSWRQPGEYSLQHLQQGQYYLKSRLTSLDFMTISISNY